MCKKKIDAVYEIFILPNFKCTFPDLCTLEIYINYVEYQGLETALYNRAKYFSLTSPEIRRQLHLQPVKLQEHNSVTFDRTCYGND